MSSPDVIDERFDELVRELRASQPVAPHHLRERVAAVAARPVPPAPKRHFTWVLAPAAAAAVAGAIAIGVLSTSESTQPPVALEAARSAKQAGTDLYSTAQAPVSPATRAQLYTVEITLRVRDLSDETQQALRITRGLGGYVRSVDYGEGSGRGTASLVLRVPIERVQTAILRYSQLGKILDQHVSVRDVQPRLDRRFTRMAELRRTIPSLSGDELAAAQAELAALQTAQARERRQVSFATVSLGLTTRDEEIVAPSPPGRIERAVRRAAEVLEAEAVAVIYAAVVAAPFILLGLALVIGVKSARRRSDGRLMGYP